MWARLRADRWRLFAVSLAAWAMLAVGVRVVLLPAERCATPSTAEVTATLDAAVGWAERSVQPDGSYAYRYDRSTGEQLGGYNLVRHAGMVTALYQAAPRVPSAESAADAGLGYMLERLVDTPDGTAFADEGIDAKLGATALFVAALHHRRALTGDTSHDDTMRSAGRFLAGQIEPNGAPAAFWSPVTGEPVWGTYSPFGTGEAFWALALLDQDLPGEGWGDSARRIGRYVAVERRDHEDHILRLPDHWAAYGFDALSTPPGEDEVRYLRHLAGDFGLMARFESTRTGEGLNHLLRGGQALGAGVGALGEGIGALRRLADREPGLEDLADDLADRAGCAVGLLADRQVRPGGPGEPGADDLETGAWFRDDVTQVDDQQHAISALVAHLDATESGLDPGSGSA
jgi:hypothetical protein